MLRYSRLSDERSMFNTALQSSPYIHSPSFVQSLFTLISPQTCITLRRCSSQTISQDVVKTYSVILFILQEEAPTLDEENPKISTFPLHKVRSQWKMK